MSDYPLAPVDYYDEKEHRRKLAYVVNLAMQGKLNNRGTITLTNSQTTTTVTDPRIEEDSVIHLSPTSSAASSENWYISSTTDGQFIITHANAGTTRTFNYTVVG